MTATKEQQRTVRKALARDRFWPSIGYEPHPGQVKIHGNGRRHRVIDAGRRFGKSQIGGHELTLEALYTHTVANEVLGRGQRREFWIVGPEYTDAEKEFRVCYNDLKKLGVPFDHPGTYNNPESGDMVITLWGGAFILHAKSAKYPGTLVGEGLSGVILAEAAKLKELVWTKYIRPTLADFRGWSLHPSTPEGKNWFYENWQRGQDPNNAEWASWKMPSWKNPFVFPEGRLDPEIAAMAADMSPERVKQEIEAEFTDFVGAVFKQWDEEIHVRNLEYDPRYPCYLAVDYGWTNPFVALVIQVDAWDNVYVLAEYRCVEKDINDIGDALSRFPLVRKCNILYPDPALPGDTNILAKKLGLKVNSNTGGELKHRLEYIRKYLKPVPEHAPEEMRQPKLFVDRTCNGSPDLPGKGLIYEMGEYRYPEHKNEDKGAPETPMDKDDHGPEALGRFFRGHYGPLSAGEGRSRPKVKKANVG